MTHDPNQVIVGSDKAVRQWLKDRFSIDTDQIFIGETITFNPFSRHSALVMQVEFYVGADDLRAFPDPMLIPRPHDTTEKP